MQGSRRRVETMAVHTHAQSIGQLKEVIFDSKKSMQENEVPELNIFLKRFLCKGLHQTCRSSGTQSGRDFGSVLTGVKHGCVFHVNLVHVCST